jgi:hypothetical protein
MLSPLLFNIFSGAMIEAIGERVKGLGMKFLFRRDGEIFDITNIKAGEGFHVWNILFADDAELLADSPENLQRLVDIFVEVSSAYGQEVSLTKSEVLVVNGNALVREENCDEGSQVSGPVVITVNGSELLTKDSFTYLGAPEDSKASMEVVVEKVERSANRAFNMRNAALFNNGGLPYMAKLRYYVVYVISVLTYACETWTLSAAQLRQLEGVQIQLLKRIFKFWSFDDKISHLDVLLLARRYEVDILPLEILIARRRLILFGACERMEPHRLCYQVLHSDLEEGGRKKGSRNSFRSYVKSDLIKFGIHESWKDQVVSEKDWIRVVKKGSLEYFRQWVIQRFKNKKYKEGDITERGRKVKELTKEMLCSMRIFPNGADENVNVSRRGRAFEEEILSTWDELRTLEF